MRSGRAIGFIVIEKAQKLASSEADGFIPVARRAACTILHASEPEVSEDLMHNLNWNCFARITGSWAR
jgi:hypothetical protein